LVLTLGCFGVRAGFAEGTAFLLRGNHPTEDLKSFLPAPTNKRLNLEIKLALRNKEERDRLVSEQQNRKSPQYHRWLTADGFTRRFGPDARSLEAVEGWLKSNGFEVRSSSLTGRYLRFSGTVAQVERALNLKMLAAKDGIHYANASDPYIPAKLGGVVAYIDGLENLHPFSPSGHFDLRKMLKGSFPFQFGPPEIYNFYDILRVHEAGITGSHVDCLGLVEDSQALADADTQFNHKYGLPDAHMNVLTPDGTVPPWGESMTDRRLRRISTLNGLTPWPPECRSISMSETRPHCRIRC